MLLQVPAGERRAARSCKQTVVRSLAVKLPTVSLTCLCQHQQVKTAATLAMHCAECVGSGASGPQQLFQAADQSGSKHANTLGVMLAASDCRHVVAVGLLYLVIGS